MPFAFSGETRDHEVSKPNAQLRPSARLGRFFLRSKELLAIAFLAPLIVLGGGLSMFEMSEARYE